MEILNVCDYMNIYTKLVFAGDWNMDTNMSLCLKFVLEVFDKIWMIDMDDKCLDFGHDA